MAPVWQGELDEQQKKTLEARQALLEEKIRLAKERREPIKEEPTPFPGTEIDNPQDQYTSFLNRDRIAGKVDSELPESLVDRRLKDIETKLVALKNSVGNSTGGGAGFLRDLSDVDAAGAADNQILKYESSTGNWIVATSSAVGGPAELSGVSNGAVSASKAVVVDANKDILGFNVVGAVDLTLSGNLTVQGTQTTIETQDLIVQDKNLTLANVASPTDITADGGGMTLLGTTSKTFNWVNATDSWTSSEHLDIAAGKKYKIGGVTKSDNWDTAYGWGDHGSAGYLATSHAASGVTTTKISNWDTAHGWGDHGAAGYLTSLGTAVVDADFASNGILTRSSAGVYSVTSDNSSQWDIAYGWGDHSTAGYTSYSNSSVDSHLNQSSATSGQVLSWNGSDYDWVAQSGGGGSYANSDVDSHLNQSTASAADVLSWNGTDYDWVPGLSLTSMSDVNIGTPQFGQTLTWTGSEWQNYTPSVYNNFNVNFHLNATNSSNVFTISSGEVLSYNGSDYEWVAQSSGGLASVVGDTTPQLGGNLDVNGNIITSASGANVDIDPDGTGNILLGDNTVIDGSTDYLVWNAPYATTGDLPNATTYHGMFAHVHGTGKAYYSHGGNWIALAKESAPAIANAVMTNYTETINSIGSIGGGTQDIDFSLGNIVTGTVDTSTTTFTFSNVPASGGSSITLILTNGGSQTVNWPASVTWPGGSAPTLTASGVDVLSLITVDGGTTFRGFTGGLNFS